MTDTTQTDAHLAAIREALNHIHIVTADEDGGTDHADDLNAILDHAEALARDLAAERARVGRLLVLFTIGERMRRWQLLEFYGKAEQVADDIRRYHAAKRACIDHGDIAGPDTDFAAGDLDDREAQP